MFPSVIFASTCPCILNVEPFTVLSSIFHSESDLVVLISFLVFNIKQPAPVSNKKSNSSHVLLFNFNFRSASVWIYTAFVWTGFFDGCSLTKILISRLLYSPNVSVKFIPISHTCFGEISLFTTPKTNYFFVFPLIFILMWLTQMNVFMKHFLLARPRFPHLLPFSGGVLSPSYLSVLYSTAHSSSNTISAIS